EDFGDLRRGESLDVPKNDRRLLLLRQLRQGGIEALPLLFRAELAVRIAAGPQSLEIERHCRVLLFFAPDIPANVHRHSNEPWLEPSPAVEPVQKPECPKKHFLCRVLGVFHAAQQSPRQSQNPPLVSQDDLLKG